MFTRAHGSVRVAALHLRSTLSRNVSRTDISTDHTLFLASRAARVRPHKGPRALHSTTHTHNCAHLPPHPYSLHARACRCPSPFPFSPYHSMPHTHNSRKRLPEPASSIGAPLIQTAITPMTSIASKPITLMSTTIKPITRGPPAKSAARSCYSTGCRAGR